ncbi:MAG TPA: CDP-alcohol phosphatidyltransferase family protein [Candidatus Saccharimonadales bacterium]|nr:CDP-alcohol phosphatidyltransferase family protein [Candidatus Saccharimonadales bacterium]
MNMHYAGDVPDWELTTAAERNAWQQLAAGTRGIVTPANVISLAGFGLVLWGLLVMVQGQLGYGTLLLAVGRLCDILDGLTADKTGTKSPLGKAVDATLDKISALAVLIIFTAMGILPVWLAVLAGLQNAANIIAGVEAQLRHAALQPSPVGKVAATALWAALIGFALTKLLTTSRLHAAHVIALPLAYVMAVAAIGLGSWAALGYARILLHFFRNLRWEQAAPLAFERFVVIRNPISTSAHRTDERLAELRAVRPDAEIIELRTRPGGSRANAALLRDHAAALGPRSLLCIAAGDGTVNMIMAFLLTDPALPDAARRTPVLPLWNGNANDLAYMLNGPVRPRVFRRLFKRGRVMAIRPLRCVLHLPNGQQEERLAACYASFGASAFAARELERTMRRKTPLRQPALTRLGQETVAVYRAMRRAPTFRITDTARGKSKDRVIFERVFLNGSRFAKVFGVPLRLTDHKFHRATIEHKHLAAIVFNIALVATGNASGRVAGTHDSFTVHDYVWAQFDGEAVRLKPGTTVEVSIAEQPFYALSTRLKK